MVKELSEKGIQNTALWQRGVDTDIFRPDLRSNTMRKKLLGKFNGQETPIEMLLTVSQNENSKEYTPYSETIASVELEYGLIIILLKDGYYVMEIYI